MPNHGAIPLSKNPHTYHAIEVQGLWLCTARDHSRICNISSFICSCETSAFTDCEAHAQKLRVNNILDFQFKRSMK